MAQRGDGGPTLGRRQFLKTAAGGFALGILASCSPQERERFIAKHFRDLTRAELAAMLARDEADLARRLGKAVTVGAAPPLAGVLYGYALDLSRCIGCRRCVYGCVAENNQSRAPQIHWIRVLQMEKAKGVDFPEATAYYNPERVPEEGHFYLPVACQQCRNPPCVKVCPVKATWAEPDGIVVVDPKWCIGCRYCMAACPYGARHFNWSEPRLPTNELNPTTHYLGNRPRPKGVVEKCTFCIQRVRDQEGRYPACVEVCPVGARKFGNLLDPRSEIRYVLENKRVLVLKEDLNTQPKFYYFYGT
jgi:Fe-S-cluster-containing dehydrogenase component